MARQPDTVAFREVQWLYQLWWALLPIGGVALFAWYGFIQQIILGQPVGDNPAPNWAMGVLWLLFGIGLPALWFLARLVVEVREAYLYIHYAPFLTREIPWEAIRGWEARTYKPIREFGGWGIRWWFGKTAYSVSGNQGVELELNDGKRLMIGSQKAEALAEAIHLKKRV